MKTMTSVVAATDFSDAAGHAAERGAIVAKEQQARLDLMHVISGSSLSSLSKLFQVSADVEARLIDDARRLLDETIADIGKATSVRASASVKTGRVLGEILLASETADLLVLGAHGLNPLRDLILGTTAERVLRTCKRPVLIVKRPPRGVYERVIVPVDFSSYSAPALKTARQIAHNARITILHAFRVPFEGKLQIADASDETIRNYCEMERREAEKKIEELTRGSGDDAHRISLTVVRGDVSRVIFAKEEELSADLIVIGKHGQSMVKELLLGSVTHHVLAGSKCDVLVVPIQS